MSASAFRQAGASRAAARIRPGRPSGVSRVMVFSTRVPPSRSVSGSPGRTDMRRRPCATHLTRNATAWYYSPMNQRTFGRTGWRVGELGYGMWGMAGWTGSDDAESLESLQLAVDQDANFFDTAYAYGDGKSEGLLGRTLRANPGKQLYVATKVPPKNRRWPSRRGDRLEDVFPAAYIREYAERSLKNLGLGTVDLLQFHVWEDEWAEEPAWQRVMEDLKREGKVRAIGV